MTIRKRFGQNFLTDPQVIDRLIAAIDPSRDDRFLEIGPGRGAMTGRLISTKCALDVIEIDRDLVGELRERFPSLSIHEGDVLKADLDGLIERGTRVVGNLPYNISTPLLFRLYPLMERIRDVHFMLQLEVVNRIAATPSSRTYGRLSVMSHYYCQAEKLFDVPPGAFTPSPKVTSAIVRLAPASHGLVANDVEMLGKLVRQAFSNRRKTIRNAFKGLLDTASLESLDIDPSLRPENLGLDEFVRCANAISEGK